MKRFAFLWVFLGWVAPTLAGSYVLTFDDAPMGDTHFTGWERTRKTFAALKEAGVEEAVFYANPGRLPLDREGKARLEAYAAAGHVIANHTWDHPRLSETLTQDYLANIERAHAALTSFATFKDWFRYPYLNEGVNDPEKHKAVKDHLAKTKRKLGYVTVETYDWYVDSRLQQVLSSGGKVNFDGLRKMYLRVIEESVQFYDELALKTIGRSPVHVILLHEKDLNAMFLKEMVAGLKAKGFHPARAQAAWNDPIASSEWDAIPGSSRRLGTIAVAQGYTGPKFTKWVDSDNLDKALEEYGVFEKR